MKKIFAYIVLASALSLAGCAAYYSVFGISKLFAAQAFAVAIMASILEVSKLVAATYLHRYWKKINILLKGYLTSAVLILMFITSIGIYGFLTASYQTTANELFIIDKQVKIIEMKKSRFQEQMDSYSSEKNQLANSITELSKGLSNNKVQWRDKETGQIMTSTSSKTRRVLQGQLNDFKIQRDKVSIKIESLADSITKLDLNVLDLESNSEAANEVGPLKYVSELLDRPMNQVVNWFILIFIFVFDPLAVVLLIGANKAFDIHNENKESILDVNSPLPGEDYDNWNEEEADRRMDIIGSNGNDGTHYDAVTNQKAEDKEDIYKEEENPKEPEKSQERTRNAYWT